jgi:hypothetical protein
MTTTANANVTTSGFGLLDEYLSLSFEVPSKWFFLGYIFYMILVVAIAVTDVFYNHLQFNMRKRITGFISFRLLKPSYIFAGLMG